MMDRKTAFELIGDRDVEGSDELYTRKVAESPGDPANLYALAVVRFNQKRYLDALSLFEECLRLKPGWLHGLFYAGYTLHMLGDNAGAAIKLCEALEIDPNLAECHYVLGLALDSGWRPEDKAAARAHYARAAELNPEWADAHYKHANVCGYSSMNEEAEKSLRRCLSIRPSLPQAQYDLAGNLLEQQRLEDAMPHLERAAELDPTLPGVRETIVATKEAIESGVRPGQIARFPRSMKDFADIRRAVSNFILPLYRDEPRFLTPSSRVMAFGSCFAAHLGLSLKRYGLTVSTLGLPEEINSTYANRGLVEWIKNGPGPGTEPFEKKFGADQRLRMRDDIERTGLFIYSLGVAPCFFDRRTNAFVWTPGINLNVLLMMRKYEFRTTTVAENVENLRAIVDTLRSLNPDSQVVLTVSPVPLRATFEFESAVVADCVSKSTLRAAVHEFLLTRPGQVRYWPSFEMVRWLGGHAGRVFGTDDDSPFHVSMDVVNAAMDAFLKIYGNEDLHAVAERMAGPSSAGRGMPISAIR